MNPEEIGKMLAVRFGTGVLSLDVTGKHPHAVLSAEAWPAAAEYLRDCPELAFDFLRAITVLDYPKESRFLNVYDLISTAHRHAFAVKVAADREHPRAASVAGIWPTANWHEREAYDLFGIVYDGHPDPRRLLLPEDWQGYPLRKDYVFPKTYNGIPCASLVNP